MCCRMCEHMPRTCALYVLVFPRALHGSARICQHARASLRRFGEDAACMCEDPVWTCQMLLELTRDTLKRANKVAKTLPDWREFGDNPYEFDGLGMC